MREKVGEAQGMEGQKDCSWENVSSSNSMYLTNRKKGRRRTAGVQKGRLYTTLNRDPSFKIQYFCSIFY